MITMNQNARASTASHGSDSPTFTSRCTAPAEGLAPARGDLWWPRLIRTFVHRPILIGLHQITNISAKYPKTVIVSVVLVSIITFVSGMLTNFSLVVDENRCIAWRYVSMSVYLAQHESPLKNTHAFNVFVTLMIKTLVSYRFQTIAIP